MKFYLRGRVDEDIALSTLAANTLISQAFDETVDEPTTITSVIAAYSIDGFTAAEGPIEVGLAHDDYTSAEIEAVIEATQSWHRGNKVEQEVAKRLVRSVGVFDADTTDDVLNDGKPIKTKLNWRVIAGAGLQAWAYNHGAGSLTTGAIVRLNGHANLFSVGRA